jgi:hypothetical protein
VALAAACSGPAPGPPHDGPIVLVTLSALRDDVVGGLGGELGLTPHLDALVWKADWAGRGVVPSSCTASSIASLLTGLRPAQHRVLHAGSPPPAGDLVTLAEALKAAGYRTAGFASRRWLSAAGYAQGFDQLAELGKGRQAAARLARLDGGRDFVWVHLPEPRAPYVRRDWLLGRIEGAPAHLPRRLLQRQIDALLAPGRRLRPVQRRALWAMYRLNVAWADERLGRLLAALEQSGQWDRTLLVVTADHGEEPDRRGGGRQGGLGRQLLEVPLIVKLPAGFPRRIAAPQEQRVATARLWATLVEAAGGPVPPAAAPSLYRRGSPAILSELHFPEKSPERAPKGAPGEAASRFSLLDGDEQLLWEPGGAGPRLERWNRKGSRPVAGSGGDARLLPQLAASRLRFVPEDSPDEGRAQ